MSLAVLPAQSPTMTTPAADDVPSTDPNEGAGQGGLLKGMLATVLRVRAKHVARKQLSLTARCIYDIKAHCHVF